MIKVLIVDDQKTVQALLTDYLKDESGIEIIGFAENGQEALDIVRVCQPDIVLMDIEMPVLDGLSATRIIVEQFVQSTVLILSVHDEDSYLNASLQVGAKGYLLKTTPAKELINAIYSAYKGYFQLGPGLLEKYLYKISNSQLKSQEVEDLKNIITEQSNLLKEINSEKSHSISNSKKINNTNNLQSEIVDLEQKLYYLNHYIEKLKKRVIYIQNMVLVLLAAVAVLILVVYLN
ncbi:MAG: response regulator transcription factor [Xenococcaceae cyanobacterium MO_167.B52]|nr:response regulator transcription factor [Xenococcaceae cyanobacterium MO_167.B52]